MLGLLAAIREARSPSPEFSTKRVITQLIWNRRVITGIAENPLENKQLAANNNLCHTGFRFYFFGG
jgi:hypothetical protein